MNPEYLRQALRLLALSAAFVVIPPAQAQLLFKCGTTFQDRPCESKDVQQRFSHTAGQFSVEQVNADTDKDCADSAARLLPFWQRMHAGTTFETIKSEIDAQSIARAEKSRLRDVLLALKQFKGSPLEVRSELERQCMNYKRLRGLPGEREIARNAQVVPNYAGIANAEAQRAYSAAAEARDRAEEQRLERARARAASRAARRSE